jgi:tRNA(Arg) A34 adenosine deaminase TadA
MRDDDLDHLRRAIALAAEARLAGDPPFGSTLVDAAGTVIAEERNTTASDNDITAHPELKLARWAARQLPAAEARTITMYTSCRPCPMCANAIRRASIGKVVFALDTAQLDALKPPGFVNPDAAEVAYEGPALLDEARGPLEGFYDRPDVNSADGPRS